MKDEIFAYLHSLDKGILLQVSSYKHYIMHVERLAIHKLIKHLGWEDDLKNHEKKRIEEEYNGTTET